MADEAVGEPLFHRVVGQKVVCSYLQRAIENARIAHAYLFTGPSGVGKDAVALDFAAALLCEKFDTDSKQAPCRICAQCRLTARLQHPDLHIIVPLPGKTGARRAAEDERKQSLSDSLDEKPTGAMAQAPREEEGGIPDVVQRKLMAAIEEKAKEPYTPILLPRALSILIEEIRDWVIDKAYLMPYQARRKVFIITQADRMNLNAQNAFLKVLEEPPSDTHLFLTCEHEGGLLETIRSRCQRIVFPPISETDIEQALCARYPELKENAAPISRLAGGSFWQALELSKMKDWDKLGSMAVDYFMHCALLDPLKLQEFYTKLLSDEFGGRRILLGILLLFVSDVALLKAARKGSQNTTPPLALPGLRKDGELRAEKLVKNFPRLQPEQAAQAIQAALDYLERGYTPHSVLTALSFQLHHALGPQQAAKKQAAKKQAA
ncbi:MAG: hypothetical protein V1784_08215 [bacterium]